jgi:hypothetical protein
MDDNRKDFDAFVRAGGMLGRERRAAADAIREEQEYWLPILEAIVAKLVIDDDGDSDSLFMASYLGGEIKRLRRVLGMTTSISQEQIARRRELTRERVRRHRQRRAEGR